MQKIIFSILLLASVSVITSCKKDKEDPTIVVAEPEDHSEFHWGEEIHAEAAFGDDRELSSYRVYVGTSDGSVASELNADFSGSISGSSYDFHEHVMIPDSVTGMFYVYFKVTDAEDKSATAQRMIHIMQ